MMDDTQADHRGRRMPKSRRLASALSDSYDASGGANAEEPIKEAAWTLLTAELEPGRTFRLLGVGVSNFGDASELGEPDEQQLPLFSGYDASDTTLEENDDHKG